MLHREGAFSNAYAIGHTFYTTDSVIDSYGDDKHPVFELINQRKIALKAFSSGEFIGIEEIYNKHKSVLSIPDCSVIYFAIATKGVVITSDNVLANICIEYNVVTNTANNYYEEVKLYKTG